MESTSLYKVRLTSVADVFKRSQNLQDERNEKRREFFWGSRLQLEQSAPIEKKKPSRAEMLKKWKEEKIKKLEEEKKKQKPIFKVGIVQRKATGSPLVTHPKTNLKKTAQQTFKKHQGHDSDVQRIRVLTRAGAKNLDVKVAEVKSLTKPIEKGLTNKFCKIDAGKRKKIDSHVFVVPESVSKLPGSGVTLPSTPTVLKRKVKNKKGKGRTTEKKAVQLNVTVQNMYDAEQNINVKLTNIEKAKVEKEQINEKTFNVRSSGEVVQEKSNQKEVALQLQTISPAKKEVALQLQTISPAKEEVALQLQTISPAKKEVALQLQTISPAKKEVESDGYRPIVFSPFVTVRIGKKSPRKSKKSLTMDVEEQIKKEESEFKCRIFSFRKYIECEKKRLLNKCDKWKNIYEEFQEVPADVEGDIDSVIGKTNLLTSDKFMQFQSLIEKCENGDPLIKVDDLQGFQDWVSIEVERIDEEFHKLEKRRNNDWKSESMSATVPKVQKVRVVKNSKKPVGSSKIRSHILAARKLLKEGNANDTLESQLQTFALEHPIKTTTPKKNESLLKDVLNLNTKKNNSVKKTTVIRERRNSGLEIMIATQKNKFPTPVKLQKSPLLSDYEIFIGEKETPGKSILKKTPKETNSSKSRVTFKKVTENLVSGGRGLSERYFQPLMDDDFTPVRTILGDLRNLTPGGIQTRSRTRLMSYSTLISPQNN